jgi:hypothetical protein
VWVRGGSVGGGGGYGGGYGVGREHEEREDCGIGVSREQGG